MDVLGPVPLEVGAVAQESLSGVRVVRAYRQEAAEVDRFQRATADPSTAVINLDDVANTKSYCCPRTSLRAENAYAKNALD